MKSSKGGEMGLRFGAEPLGKVFEVFRDALSAGELNQQRHIGGRRLRGLHRVLRRFRSARRILGCERVLRRARGRERRLGRFQLSKVRVERIRRGARPCGGVRVALQKRVRIHEEELHLVARDPRHAFEAERTEVRLETFARLACAVVRVTGLKRREFAVKRAAVAQLPVVVAERRHMPRLVGRGGQNLMFIRRLAGVAFIHAERLAPRAMAA